MTPNDLVIPNEPKLPTVKTFLKDFNENVGMLNISGLKPIKFDDWDLVCRKLEKEQSKNSKKTSDAFENKRFPK